jgi:hypothetical protein
MTLLGNIIKGNTVRIITKFGLTGKVKIGKGVHQGDPVSPILFNIAINQMLKNIEMISNIDLLGWLIGALAFADDLVLVGLGNEWLESVRKILTEFTRKSEIRTT